MKKARIKQQKQKKDIIASEGFSTKSKIITGVILVLLLVGFYIMTIKLVKNRGKEEPEKVTINVRETNNINYSDIEKIEASSYYVLLYKEDDENNSSYDSYINALKYSNYPDEFYYINLSSDENKKLLSDKEELKDVDKLKVKDTTLIYVSENKIKESYVGSEKIIAQLQSFFVSAETEENNSNSNEKSNKEDKSNKTSNEKSNKDEKSNKSSNEKSNKENKSNKTSNEKSNKDKK